MVHRPADSRLLTNLLSHEKDYSKHLGHLLEHSQVSLASFSAYASASAPPLSQVIIAVAGTLAGADDALRKYAASLEGWQAQLKALKDLEDEVGNVMRDREILVTRLIKASKQQKPTRDSLLGASGSSSSLNFPKPEVSVGPKLSSAQTELQACEAHLAMKERELDSLRVSAVQSGLQARCKAMVECGWTWGEMGKEGLRALEIMNAHNGHGSHPYSAPARASSSRYSDSGHAGSDNSSLAPSQSASQIGMRMQSDAEGSWRAASPDVIATPPKPYSFHIPPAHSISESAVTNGRPPAHWRISEVDEEESGGSSEEEVQDPAAVEVHENERFMSKRKAKASAKASASAEPQRAFSIRSPKESTDTDRRVHFPPPSPIAESSPEHSKKKDRHRSGSMSLFGRSLAALFHKDKGTSHADGRDSSPPPSTGSRWHTRTDRYLAKSRRADDSSGDEGPSRGLYSTWSPVYARSSDVPVPQSKTSLVPSPSEPVVPSTPQRLKKKARRASAQVHPTARPDNDANKGWISDGGNGSGAEAKVKRAASVKRSDSVQIASPKMNGDAVLHNPDPSTSRARTSATSGTLAGNGSKTSLARNNSLSKQSVMSAPSAPARAASPIPPLPPLARKRTASVDMTDSAPKPSATAHVKGHRRTASVAAPHRSGLTRDNDGPSLMSIVEGVSKQNRDAWAHQDPDRMLVLPKAPPPANVSIDLDAIPRATAGPSQPRVPSRRSSPLLNHSQMSASASAPSLPATASRPPVKMPLRSALRNSSRTPSPNPPLPASSGSLSAALNGATPAAAPPNTSNTLTVPNLKKDDDAISISSYETGHEELDDPEPEPAPPPPPQEEKPHGLGGSDLSQSTSSTMMTGTAPTRRKSVRMSLPPTFSVTPPAIDDDDSPRGRHSPWSSKTAERPAMYTGPTGWSSRVPDHRQRDMWEDSSDEDEGYSAARRLLSRM